MKYSLLFASLAPLLLLLGCTGPRTNSPEETVGYGWAKNAVNAVIFRKNSVVSHQGVQYTAYYDSTAHVVLAKRTLPSGAWETWQTQYRGNVKDAHNSISLMVDGDGFLHLAWDHHNQPLRYCRSTHPGSLELTEKMPMVGKDEERVSYPEFYRFPDGDLSFPVPGRRLRAGQPGDQPL